jgi:two-component system response regulator PrrA
METILIIDDDKDFSRFLDRFLSALGFMPIVAESGEEGLQLLSNVRPGLVLLDWVLGEGLSARQTLRSLKSNAATRTIPVVVMSGLKKDADDELNARNSGASSFLSKDEISDTARDKDVLKRRFSSLIMQGRSLESKRVLAESRGRAAVRGGRVLIIDDDGEMRDYLARLLRDRGLTLNFAENGTRGLEMAHRDPPDLVLLDLTLPDMDGLDICSQLKTLARTRPISLAVLSAEISEQARLLTVEYGADYHFEKPLKDINLFCAVVDALVRRRATLERDPSVLVVADIRIDTAAMTVSKSGKTVDGLTPTLFRLLCEFARHPNEVMSRERLVRAVWKRQSSTHNVDTFIGRLKKALGVNADWFPCVYGVGFKMLPR